MKHECPERVSTPPLLMTASHSLVGGWVSGFRLVPSRVSPGTVQGSGFRGQGAEFRVQGSGCRVQGSGLLPARAWLPTPSASRYFYYFMTLEPTVE